MIPTEVRLEDANEDFVCATYKNVIVYVFHTSVTIDVLKRISVIHNRLKMSFPKQTISVSISIPNTGLPDAETRKFSSEQIKRTRADEVVSAVLLEGSGMWAAGARALITGVFLVSGSLRRNRVFAQADLCAAWAVPLSLEALDVAELTKVIKTVRATAPRANAKLGVAF